jgi:hypothetical protein
VVELLDGLGSFLSDTHLKREGVDVRINDFKWILLLLIGSNIYV